MLFKMRFSIENCKIWDQITTSLLKIIPRSTVTTLVISFCGTLKLFKWDLLEQIISSQREANARVSLINISIKCLPEE